METVILGRTVSFGRVILEVINAAPPPTPHQIIFVGKESSLSNTAMIEQTEGVVCTHQRLVSICNSGKMREIYKTPAIH